MIKNSTISYLLRVVELLFLAIFITTSQAGWISPTNSTTINDTYVFNVTYEIIDNTSQYNITISYNNAGNFSGPWTELSFSTNTTDVDGNISFNASINTRSLPDGNYTFNYTLWDRTDDANPLFVSSSLITNVLVDNNNPTILSINITDGNNILMNGSGVENHTRFLKNGTNLTVTVSINETVGFGAKGGPRIYWNTTQAANFNSTYTDTGAYMVYESADSTGSVKIFSYTIDPAHFSHGTNFSFIIVVNDTSARDPSIANGTFGNGFNFTIDGTPPTKPIITEPSSTTITVLSETGIDYSCSSSDEISSIDYTWTLTKPDGSTLTFNGTSVTNFNGTNINKAGTYEVTCKATDEVGYSSTSSKVTFTATNGAGGGATSGSSRRSSTEVDSILNEITGETYNLGAIPSEGVSQLVSEGSGGEFTIDGTTHAFIVYKVGSSYVEISVASPNATNATIYLRKASEFDLDGDGTNDLRVSLNKITNGEADLTFTALETTVPPTKKKSTASTPKVRKAPTAELTWLWILLAAIVVGGVIYYYYNKKK